MGFWKVGLLRAYGELLLTALFSHAYIPRPGSCCSTEG